MSERSRPVLVAVISGAAVVLAAFMGLYASGHFRPGKVVRTAQGTVEANLKIPPQEAPLHLYASAKGIASAQVSGTMSVFIEINGTECGRNSAYRNPGTPELIEATADCELTIPSGNLTNVVAKAPNNLASAVRIDLGVEYQPK